MSLEPATLQAGLAPECCNGCATAKSENEREKFWKSKYMRDELEIAELGKSNADPKGREASGNRGPCSS